MASMYSVQNIVNWTSIDFTMKEKVMYDVSSFHKFNLDDDPKTKVIQILDSLEKRVDLLLKQKDLSGTHQPKVAVVVPKDKDLVIQCSPDRAQLLSGVINALINECTTTIALKCYRHSSLTADDLDLVQELHNVDNNNAHVKISLIATRNMKTFGGSTSHCALFMSAVSSQPIVGEANITRYLCRIFSPELYNEQMSALDLLSIDVSLDRAYSCHNLQQLTAYFRKYLAEREGTAMTVVDLVLFCRLELFNVKSMNNVQNYKAWYDGSNKAFKLA